MITRGVGGIMAAATIAVLASAGGAFAQNNQPELDTQFVFPYADTGQPSQVDKKSTTDAVLRDTESSSGGPDTASGTEIATYGSLSVAGTLTDAGNYGGRLGVLSEFKDFYTFTFDDPSQVPNRILATFTGHLSGTATGSGGSGGSDCWLIHYNLDGNVTIDVDGYNGADGHVGCDGYSDGTPLSALANFTMRTGIPTGNQLELELILQANASGGPSAFSTSAALQLNVGSFVVRGYNSSTDDYDIPVDFTATSHTGSARNKTVPAGGSFSGINLTNTAPGRVGSTFWVLAGNASAQRTVQAAFVAPPAPSEVKLASDAIDVAGFGTEAHVVQLSYDPVLAKTLFGGQSKLRLAWLNPATSKWVNAVLGNKGGAPEFFNRAYDPLIDFHLGNFGIDTTRHVVWAVINHNSEFGVSVVPDPPGTTLGPTATPTPPAKLQNISTRMEVQNGDNVLIAGFIVTGTDAKKVIIRGLGPSLPLAGTLADPVLELHDARGYLVTYNDNWKIDPGSGESQEAAIRATKIQPANDLESAILATLPANNSSYTVKLYGNTGSGIGGLEVYDIGRSGDNSQLANISTRGFIDTGNNVMIGGFIAGPTGSASTKVLVRAIGPSLPVSGALQDPALELHDSNGATIATNDNWKINDASGQSQADEVTATGAAPTNDNESALVETLAPGAYTAVVRGKNNTTGVGLVEVYNLQ